MICSRSRRAEVVVEVYDRLRLFLGQDLAMVMIHPMLPAAIIQPRKDVVDEHTDVLVRPAPVNILVHGGEAEQPAQARRAQPFPRGREQEPPPLPEDPYPQPPCQQDDQHCAQHRCEHRLLLFSRLDAENADGDNRSSHTLIFF